MKDVDQYEINETEIRGKSLLNRDSEGRYKFSHKSILEYFLALEMVQNGRFLSEFDFDGMSFAEKCLDEMIFQLRGLNGQFSLEKGDVKELRMLEPRDISKITSLTIREIGDLSPLTLGIFVNLEELILFDHQKFSQLYVHYRGILNERKNGNKTSKVRSKTSTEIRAKIEEKWGEVKPNLRALNQRVRKLRRNASLTQLEDLCAHLEILESPKANFMENVQLGVKVLMPKIKKRGVAALSGNADDVMQEAFVDYIINTWPRIDLYVKQIQQLQEKLPRCVIWY